MNFSRCCFDDQGLNPVLQTHVQNRTCQFGFGIEEAEAMQSDCFSGKEQGIGDA
jgi:hypothetical protein